MKRVTWFVGGVATGAVGAHYAKRKVRHAADQFTPAQLARGMADRVGRQVRHLADAVREGREAMVLREDELRARRDGRVEPLDAHLGPSDRVLVDGRQVEPGRVILLRQAK